MNPNEFYRRRQSLLRLIGQNSLAILPAAPQAMRNHGINYPYRQNSDFYYLTGFPEPEAIAVLTPGKDTQYTLFCQERDPTKEIWYGSFIGPERAVRQFGADAAYPLNKLDEELPKMLEQTKRLYYAVGSNANFDLRITGWINAIRNKIRTGIRGPTEIIILDHCLHELRLIKNSAEITAMRTAATLSAKAHIRLMQTCRPGMIEYELEAEFLHSCVSNGARHQAYSPIVGGGANGCILHYESNQDILNDGELVLIDAGCEYDYYAADITRTFPINGRFNSAQREIYELVLEAQKAALKKVKPGATWEDMQKAAVHVITKGLLHLGVFKGTTRSLAKLIKSERYKPFYMHKIGHWIGMDAHDVGTYKIDNEWRALEPGMCLTVEPGIYIAKDATEADERFRGIGIRIEDDVVVTTNGHEVLSAAVPKSIVEIESLMNNIK